MSRLLEKAEEAGELAKKIKFNKERLKHMTNAKNQHFPLVIRISEGNGCSDVSCNDGSLHTYLIDYFLEEIKHLESLLIQLLEN
jgi:hypothetical protein